MALKMDHTGAGDITLDSTQAGELRVDGVPVFIPDLTGAADNDLLFRSGGSWIDTAGDLTWDGTTLSLAQEKGIQLASAPNGTADFYMDGTTLYIDGSDPTGILGDIRTDASFFLTDPNKNISCNVGYGSFVDGTSARLVLYGDNAVTSNHRSEIGAFTTGELYLRQPTSSSQTILIGGSALSSGASAYFASFDDTVADFDVTIVTEASTASTAFFRLPHGTAPTTPVNGDMWTTTAGVFARVNGVTEDLTAGAATLGDLSDVDLTGAADNDLLYRSGGNWIDSAGGFTYDGTNVTLSGEITLTADAPALTGNANATASVRRLLQFDNWDGVSAYDLNWRMIYNTGTGNAAQAQIQTHTGSVWETLVAFDADGGANSVRLLFPDGFTVQNDPALFTGGSSSAPGIAFSAETGTGFYRSGAQNLDITVNGSQMVNISDATSTGLLSFTGSVLTVNRNANASSAIHVGETATLRGNSQDSYIRLYGEDTSAIGFAQIEFNGVNTIFTNGGDLYLQDGPLFRVYDSGNTDYIQLSHDGTDATLAFVSSADVLFTSGSRYKFDNSVYMTETSSTRGLSFDSEATDNVGIKRITWNDGAGNFNINSNVRYSAGQIFASAGAGAQLRFDTDSAPATIFLRTSNNTSGATQDSAVTWGPGITIQGGATGTIEFDGDATFNNLIYPEGQTTGYIRAVTGDYGSIEVIGADGSLGTWSGYSIGGEAVFMSDLGTATTQRIGLYDDNNNAWLLLYNGSTTDKELDFYFAGNVTLSTCDEDTESTGAQLRHADQSFYPVGMNVASPKVNPSGWSATATWLDYAGHTIIKGNTTAFTATLPQSTVTSLPNGGVWTFCNLDTNNISIALPGTNNPTFTWLDGLGGTTGARTIAPGGVATLYRRNANNWYIWGNGIS